MDFKYSLGSILGLLNIISQGLFRISEGGQIGAKLNQQLFWHFYHVLAQQIIPEKMSYPKAIERAWPISP